MKSFLINMFEYNQFANQQIIRCFIEDGFSEEESIRLFSHLINAHHTWLARLQEKNPMFDVWEIHVKNSFFEVDSENHRQTLELLQNTTDLEMNINYTNSKGKAFRSSFQDILMHIINHSTYHRAQIARMIRLNGLVPPNTDYIFYKREQQ